MSDWYNINPSWSKNLIQWSPKGRARIWVRDTWRYVRCQKAKYAMGICIELKEEIEQAEFEEMEMLTW